MTELRVYFKDDSILTIQKAKKYTVLDGVLDVLVSMGEKSIDRYTIDWHTVKYVLEMTRP